MAYAQEKQERIKFCESQTYSGNDLGLTIHNNHYQFKVWSPTAQKVTLNLYQSGDIKDSEIYQQYPMTREEQGIWSLSIGQNLEGLFYTYTFSHPINGYEEVEAPDLYSKAVGINGDRSAIIHWEDTHPDEWKNDSYVHVDTITDAIIWEVHVRDFSTDVKGGFSPEHQGKYLAFTEKNTSLFHANEFSTGLHYLKKLGVNMIHLLPIFDHENDELSNDYNWGYNPKNFMVPEGQYATNPVNPITRIREVKQMIQAIHSAGMGVVMDVAFNHTYQTERSWFQYTVPDYYYRQTEWGDFSNGSGVGNETASERTMMRKYMIDALLYWAKEYHIDGFRFDLMGLHDTETMNLIRQAFDQNGLEKTILYGEPWMGGASALSEGIHADKSHVSEFSERIAIFNDEFRDAIKGQVFNRRDGAFLQGGNHPNHTPFKDVDLMAAITANTVSKAGNISWDMQKAWARSPQEVVNYSSAHDNLTLYDKLVLAFGRDPNYERQEDIIARNKINAVVLMTSQGAIFMQAGEELGRTKFGNDNSYNAPLSINQIDWPRAKENKDLVDYYRGMIAIRKMYSPLRDATNLTAQSMIFINLPENALAYKILNVTDNQCPWKEMLVAVNTGTQPVLINLNEGARENQEPVEWTILATHKQAGTKSLGIIYGYEMIVNPLECYVLVRH